MNRPPPERDAVRFALDHARRRDRARRRLWRLIWANESVGIVDLPAP